MSDAWQFKVRTLKAGQLLPCGWCNDATATHHVDAGRAREWWSEDVCETCLPEVENEWGREGA